MASKLSSVLVALDYIVDFTQKVNILYNPWLTVYKKPKDTHLVVDYHMNSAMCCVRWKVTQVESLIYNSLSCKSSITMYQ